MMYLVRQGLGTQLRHLLELLDGAVEQAYVDAGLAYRPRYTPIMRVLVERDVSTVGAIAVAAGITQPAATQTIAKMVEEGLVTAQPGQDDARQREVRLTRKGRALVPRLRACWRATQAAADGLDAELSSPLSQLLGEAIEALKDEPFGARIARARAALTNTRGIDDEAKVHVRSRSTPPRAAGRVRAERDERAGQGPRRRT